MQVWRRLIHVQDHVKHVQVGVSLLEGLGKLLKSSRSLLTARRPAAAVLEVPKLEYCLMEQFFLLSLPDVLVIVRDLIPCLFLFGIVSCQCLIEKLVVHLMQIFVTEGHIQVCPALIDVRSRKHPVIVPDAPLACHARYCYLDTITLTFHSLEPHMLAPILP